MRVVFLFWLLALVPGLAQQPSSLETLLESHHADPSNPNICLGAEPASASPAACKFKEEKLV